MTDRRTEEGKWLEEGARNESELQLPRWSHYVSWVDEDSVGITDDKTVTRLKREPIMEKYGEDVIIPGRCFLILPNGEWAFRMTRWTKAEIEEIDRKATELAEILEDKRNSAQ